MTETNDYNPFDGLKIFLNLDEKEIKRKLREKIKKRNEENLKRRGV